MNEAALSGEVLPSVAVEPPESLHVRMQTACMEMANMELQAGALAVKIGKLALQIKARPDVMQLAGCKGFEEYKSTFILPHFTRSRSAVGNFIACAESWGHRSLEECSQVGVNKMMDIRRYCEGPTAEALFEFAKTSTQNELREEMDRRGIASKGETTGASVTITGSLDTIKDIKRFLAEGNGAQGIALALADHNNGVSGSHAIISGTKRQVQALNAALEEADNAMIAILMALGVNSDVWMGE